MFVLKVLSAVISICGSLSRVFVIESRVYTGSALCCRLFINTHQCIDVGCMVSRCSSSSRLSARQPMREQVRLFSGAPLALACHSVFCLHGVRSCALPRRPILQFSYLSLWNSTVLRSVTFLCSLAANYSFSALWLLSQLRSCTAHSLAPTVYH